MTEKKNLRDESINEKDKNGWTRLDHAIRNGNLLEVKHLLSQGADCNAQNGLGETPLHIAVEESQTENHLTMLRELIKHGANCNILNSRQWTPMHQLFLSGHYMNEIPSFCLEGDGRTLAEWFRL